MSDICLGFSPQNIPQYFLGTGSSVLFLVIFIAEKKGILPYYITIRIGVISSS